MQLKQVSQETQKPDVGDDGELGHVWLTAVLPLTSQPGPCGAVVVACERPSPHLERPTIFPPGQRV